MNFLLLSLCLLQEPASQIPPAPAPEATQEKPAAPKPPRSREDRFEARVTEEPQVPTDPVAAKPVDPYPGWQEFNRPALIVNEELLTLRDIQRGVARRIREQQRKDPDMQFMIAEEVTARARNMLQIQGGKDLGFDPEQVDRMVSRYMTRQTESVGGVTRLAEGLKREDKDSFARKEEISDYVNGKLWTESVTGLSPGPGGRVMRDPFVRPGRCLFEYREALKNQPKTRAVETTQLILTLGNPPAPGADERITRRLEELRARVENGEDMGELAELYGATEKGKRGRSPFLSLAALRKSNPEIAGFLDQAQVGELSPVLPYLQAGKRAGYIVVRAEEFRVSPVEPFDDPAGQRRCLLAYRDRLDNYRLQKGLSDLLAAAYVWPPLSLGGPESTP